MMEKNDDIELVALRDVSSHKKKSKNERDGIIKSATTILSFLTLFATTYLTILSVFRRPYTNPFHSIDRNSTITSTITHQHTTSVLTLFVILFCSITAGNCAKLLRLPPLLGMLLIGIALRNIAFTSSFLDVDKEWAIFLRKFAFLIILLRGGLGLDANTLRRLKGACLRLAFIPCTVEALAVAASSYFLLSLNPIFALMLGFVLGAVSPAVVVPGMLDLQRRGLGTASGVPALVIAAASIDDVYAITAFSVFLTIAFSTGDLLKIIALAPLEVIGGVTIGITIGMFLWHLPNPRQLQFHLWRFSLLISMATTLMFVTVTVGLDSAGPIAVLVAAFTAGVKWKKTAEEMTEVSKQFNEELPQEQALTICWNWFFQPLLFALIGFELQLEQVGISGAIFGLVTLLIGLAFRVLAAFLACLGAGFSVSERLFIALAWLPKATVQAALGSIALDIAESVESSDAVLHSGTTILTVAVLSILVSAPLGALLIRLTARRLLKPASP